MLTDILTGLGLTKEEATLYQALLDHGTQSAAALSKTSGIQRTYIYKIGKALSNRHLITMQRVKATTLFSPLSPDNLMIQAESQKQQASQAESALENLLPSLKTQYQTIESKPVIKHYEGEKGIIKANLEVLAEKKEILAYLLIDLDIDKKMEAFWKKYYEQRIKENIHVRAITPDTQAGKDYQKRDKIELRETKLVPKDQFPIAIEKNIVGNKVVLFSVKGNTLIATIIENKEIADTERAIFELAWRQSASYDQIAPK